MWLTTFSGRPTHVVLFPISFGIVMWEIATRELPYRNQAFEFIQDVSDAVCSGERPTVPSGVPQDYKELMTDCWSGNPTDRPNFTQVVHRLERIQDSRNAAEQRNIETESTV